MFVEVQYLNYNAVRNDVQCAMPKKFDIREKFYETNNKKSHLQKTTR